MTGSKPIRRRAFGGVAGLLIILASIHMGGAILVDDSPIIDDPDDPDDMAIMESVNAGVLGGLGIVAVGVGIGYGASQIADYYGSDPKAAEEEETIQTKIKAYSRAYGLKTSNNLIQTRFDNNDQASRVALKMEALNQVVQAKENGKNETQAVNAAMEELQNRTSKKEATLINQYNVFMKKLVSLMEFSEEEGFITSSNGTEQFANNPDRDYTAYHSGPWIDVWNSENFGEFWNFGNVANTTLRNGSSRSVYFMEASGDISLGNQWNNYNTLDLRFPEPESSNDLSEYLPTSGRVTIRLADEVKQMNSQMNTLRNNYDQAKIEVSDMASKLYNSDYNLTTDDVVTPFFAEYLYGNNQQSALLATMYQQAGLMGPAMNDVGNMTITLADNSTMRGMLMSDSQPPNGSWEFGKSYDPANMSGNQYILTETGRHKLTQPFSVGTIYGIDGAEKKSVDVVDRSLNVSSVQAYLDSLERLQRQYAESQAREEDAEAGGIAVPDVGGWFNGLQQLAQVIVVGLILLVVAIIFK